MDQKSILKYLFEISRDSKHQMTLLIVCRVLIALMTVTSALVLREIINAAVASQSHLFFFYFSLLMLMIICRIMTGTLSRILQEKLILI